MTNRYEQCCSSSTMPPKMLTGAPLMVIPNPKQKNYKALLC